MKKMTTEQYKIKLKEKTNGQYEILTEYPGSHKKALFRHIECGYEWCADPWSLWKLNGCPKCSNKWKRDTESFKQEVYELVGDEYEVIGEYVDGKTPIAIKHNSCGNVYETLPISFKSKGCRCPKCSRPNYHETTQTFSKRLADKYDGQYKMLSEYTYARRKVEVLCEKCGTVWECTPDNLMRGHGCPKCHLSRGEEVIEKWLRDNAIPYKPQYSTPECKYKRLLRFDFAVYDSCGNVQMLIEYDGLQHFQPVRFCSTMKSIDCEKEHSETVIKDGIKSEYCKKSAIKLLRISHKQFNDIHKILSANINSKSIPCQAS